MSCSAQNEKPRGDAGASYLPMLAGLELVAQSRPHHTHIGIAPRIARRAWSSGGPGDHGREAVETVVEIFASQEPVGRNHPFEAATCHPTSLGAGESRARGVRDHSPAVAVDDQQSLAERLLLCR